jgi:RimJ/RimL family protein N-acetyltransferase
MASDLGFVEYLAESGRMTAAHASCVRPTRRSTRLALTPLHESDAYALFEYRSDPEAYLYQTWLPSSVEEALQFIAGLQTVAFDTPGTWSQLGIRLRDVGVRRSGRQRLYRLSGEGLKPIHDWVGQYERFWNESFDRLADDLAADGLGRR